jgi:hypothetical protein
MGQVNGMSNAIHVDTDVLVDFLRGNDKAIALINARPTSKFSGRKGPRR